jgi:hypothetical protein
MDWVGLFATSASDMDFLQYRFLNGTTTPPAIGLTSAVFKYRMPYRPGTYNLRFFKNATFAKLATSQTITVKY